MTYHSDSTAIVILAAGESRRMGTSKQLLMVENTPLLRRSAEIAVRTTQPVWVVLGANESAHRGVLSGCSCKIVVNPNWREGMGTSIQLGLASVCNEARDASAILLMVCDQPLVTTAHLLSLLAQSTLHPSSRIASGYADTMGVPAIFPKTFFSQLMKIPPSMGARKLLADNPETVVTVPLPGGEIDLDTPEDYKTFIP